MLSAGMRGGEGRNAGQEFNFVSGSFSISPRRLDNLESRMTVGTRNQVEEQMSKKQLNLEESPLTESLSQATLLKSGPI